MRTELKDISGLNQVLSKQKLASEQIESGQGLDEALVLICQCTKAIEGLKNELQRQQEEAKRGRVWRVIWELLLFIIGATLLILAVHFVAFFVVPKAALFIPEDYRVVLAMGYKRAYELMRLESDLDNKRKAKEQKRKKKRKKENISWEPTTKKEQRPKPPPQGLRMYLANRKKKKKRQKKKRSKRKKRWSRSSSDGNVKKEDLFGGL